jgi:hypothetical protein
MASFMAVPYSPVYVRVMFADFTAVPYGAVLFVRVMDAGFTAVPHSALLCCSCG